MSEEMRSWTITVVGYDSPKRDMLITFADGARCVVLDTSFADYQAMLAAERAGSLFCVVWIDGVPMLAEVDKLKRVSFDKPYGATGMTGPTP